MSATEQQKLLILDWARKVHTLEHAHRFESKSQEGLSSRLANCSMIIAAVVAALTAWPTTDGSDLKGLFTGLSVLGSVFVVILSGMQANLKPSEIAEKHRYSSSSYEELRHRIELLIVTPGLTSDHVMTQLPTLERDFEKLRQHTPNVSNDHFKQGKDMVSSLGTYPKAMKFEQSP